MESTLKQRNDALADFISVWLCWILSVAGFGGFYLWLAFSGFYHWLALADFISGYPTENGRGVLDRSALHFLFLGGGSLL